ncbi:hypothetical protein [Thermodesulfatator atlanticus]
MRTMLNVAIATLLFGSLTYAQSDLDKKFHTEGMKLFSKIKKKQDKASLYTAESLAMFSNPDIFTEMMRIECKSIGGIVGKNKCKIDNESVDFTVMYKLLNLYAQNWTERIEK